MASNKKSSQKLVNLSRKIFLNQLKKGQFEYIEEVQSLNRRVILDKEPVVLLVTGGIDSTVLWNWLLEETDVVVYPLYVREKKTTGNSRGNDIAVRFFSNFFSTRYPQRSIPVKEFKVATFPLAVELEMKALGPKFFHPRQFLKNFSNDQIEYQLIPNRIYQFPLAGLQYCRYLLAREDIEVNTILTGILATDGLTIPGQSLTQTMFYEKWLRLLSINDKLRYFSPFFNLSLRTWMEKEDVVRLGMDYGLPLEKTWSCNRGYVFPCQTCNSCKHRKYVFEQLGYMLPKAVKKRRSILKKIRLNWGIKRMFRKVFGRYDLTFPDWKETVEKIYSRFFIR